MKGKPKIITPTAESIRTPNPFAALSEAPEEATEAKAESVEAVEDIPDDEYLPNRGITAIKPLSTTSRTHTTTAAASTTEGIALDELSLSTVSSISTMGSTDYNNDAFSKTKISTLMERIQPDSTKSITAYTYADIANFQEILGHALVTLPSDKSEFGYSFLVDSNEDHQTRTESQTLPDAMPSLPPEPDYLNKAIYKQYLSNKKHYHACKQVTDHGLELLQDKFPECLRLLRTCGTGGQLPRTLNLKLSLIHI